MEDEKAQRERDIAAKKEAERARREAKEAAKLAKAEKAAGEKWQAAPADSKPSASRSKPRKERSSNDAEDESGRTSTSTNRLPPRRRPPARCRTHQSIQGDAARVPYPYWRHRPWHRPCGIAGDCRRPACGKAGGRGEEEGGGGGRQARRDEQIQRLRNEEAARKAAEARRQQDKRLEAKLGPGWEVSVDSLYGMTSRPKEACRKALERRVVGM